MNTVWMDPDWLKVLVPTEEAFSETPVEGWIPLYTLEQAAVILGDGA